jgi:hypothetical protein
VHGRLNELGIQKTVQFEDNLSAHTTEASKETWRQLLPNCTQRLFPPNTTSVLQPIDRHLGIIYKHAAYRKLRSLMFEKVQGGMTRELSSREKRIALTHAFGETHLDLALNDKFARCFVATGTWTKLDGSQNQEVDLQGLEKYNFAATVNAARLEEAKAMIESEDAQAVADAEEARRQAEELRKAQEELFSDAAIEGASLLNAVQADLVTAANETVRHLAGSVQRPYIIWGSFPAKLFADVYRKQKESATKLLANDVDVFYGEFGEGKHQRIEYNRTTLANALEVNTIRCQNLNMDDLVEGCDINAVQAGFTVDENGEIAWRIGPAFFHFILSDHTLRPINLGSPSATMVRLAYKAYQLRLPVTYDGLNCLRGVVFESHSEKVKALNDWSDNPFLEFRLIKDKHRAVYHFERTSCAAIPCAQKATLTCQQLMCKTHCQQQGKPCRAHKQRLRSARSARPSLPKPDRRKRRVHVERIEQDVIPMEMEELVLSNFSLLNTLVVF